MRAYSLSHLSDLELKGSLTTVIVGDRASTATVLAHIAEFDARRLYVAEGYPSMYAYCVHELRLSEDAAYKRIQSARVAREFPALFEAVADGRLHLSAVVLLAPFLRPENADDLLAGASHKTKAEIEELLARRFPRSETLGLVVALPAPSPSGDGELAPGQVERLMPETPQLAPQVGARSKLAPVAAERYRLEVTIGRTTQEKLRYIQDLLGHQLPSGDVAQVLDQSFDALIEKLEKRKFAATRRPRRSMRPSTNPRHIPAHVKRAVWERDGGQCTFVSEAGHRCQARKLLEFDHVEEVARGAGRAWPGFGCAAGPTISSARSARSEPGSCTTSARRRSVRRKPGGRRPRPGLRRARRRKKWLPRCARSGSALERRDLQRGSARACATPRSRSAYAGRSRISIRPGRLGKPCQCPPHSEGGPRGGGGPEFRSSAETCQPG